MFLIAGIKNLKCNDTLCFLWTDVFYLIVILSLLSKFLNIGNIYECIFISTGVESIFVIMNVNNNKLKFIIKVVMSIIFLFLIGA